MFLLNLMQKSFKFNRYLSQFVVNQPKQHSSVITISRVDIYQLNNNKQQFSQFRLLSSSTPLRMVLAKKITYAKVFSGQAKETDFLVEEEKLPEPQDGEFVVEALYLSVDPYMRAYFRTYTLGQTMIGEQVAQVIESKNPKVSVGTKVVGDFGWRTHTLVKEDDKYRYYPLPDLGEYSPSLGLGVLGMPGNTAYFGFLEICKPQPGEVVVVSGAAGAVGNHVGQIARIKGCTVVGIAGSDEKCKWLKGLGFDHAINYKNPNWVKELEEATPNGIDCYFDNVGGKISSIIISKMNLFGRVSVCGSISAYEDTEVASAPILQPSIVMKQLSIQGFIVSRWLDRWMEGIQANLQWIKEGKLKYKETVTSGFENMPKAFLELFKGENIGKAVVSAKAATVDNQSIDFKSTFDAWKEKNQFTDN